MKKYTCEECGKKVRWVADGGDNSKKAQFGQQFALNCDENTPTSFVMTAFRIFLCYTCAKKRSWDIFK